LGIEVCGGIRQCGWRRNLQNVGKDRREDFSGGFWSRFSGWFNGGNRRGFGDRFNGGNWRDLGGWFAFHNGGRRVGRFLCGIVLHTDKIERTESERNEKNVKKSGR
jgi:hypothetical protein